MDGLIDLESVGCIGDGEVFEGNALAYLQAIYQGRIKAEFTRMRAAAIAIPFEQPKLQATAITHYDGDFADRLDRAIVRSSSAQPKVIDQPMIEHQPAEPEPQVTPAEMRAPFAKLRRRA